MARYGLSRATFYRRLADGTLPKPPRYPGRVWRLADLERAEAVRPSGLSKGNVRAKTIWTDWLSRNVRVLGSENGLLRGS